MSAIVRPCQRPIAVGSAAFSVADDKPTFWDRVEAGNWEAGTFAVLDRFVDPSTVLLDLGAWVGPVSLYGAARGAQVVAVEADPAALSELRANIAVNPDLARRISVVDRAVAAKAGTVRMGARRKPGDSMSSTLLAGAERSWEAPAITPETLVSMRREGVRLFVKLDIEGGEYDLLPALIPHLAAPVAVLVSLHPAILRDSGSADVDGATRAALAGFIGWDAFVVTADGIEAQDLGATLAQGGLAGDWLFLRDWPSAALA